MIGVALFILAATAPAPEECVVPPGRRAVVTATFQGKTYGFTKPECRDVFLSDPERYSQLYDALAELMAEGVSVERPDDASLVPS